MFLRYFLALIVTISTLMFVGRASAEDVVELKVSRLGDVEMGCGRLSEEAVVMRDIVYTTQDIKDESRMKSNGITAVGAVGSFLIGTATGGIGLAAAGFLMDHNVSETAEDADGVQDIAEQRRSLMMGIYNAKGCYGPLEHAMQDSVSQDGAVTQLASIETAAGEGDSDYDYDSPPLEVITYNE